MTQLDIESQKSSNKRLYREKLISGVENPEEECKDTKEEVVVNEPEPVE